MITNNGTPQSGNTTQASGAYNCKFTTWSVVIDAIYCGIFLYLTACQIIVYVRLYRKKQISCGFRSCADFLTAPSVIFSAVIFSQLTATFIFVLLIAAHYDTSLEFLRWAPAVTGFVSFMGVYLVLWLRQTSFYNNPKLSHLTNAPLRYFSYFQLGLVVAKMLGLSYGAIAVRGDPQSLCRDWLTAPGWEHSIILVAQYEFQIALVVLFIWPLYKHQQTMSKSPADVDQTGLICLIRKAVCVAVASIVIDSVGTVILYFTLSAAIFSAVETLNHVAMLFCFADWKDRLMPWRSVFQNCYAVKEPVQEMETRESIGPTRESRDTQLVI